MDLLANTIVFTSQGIPFFLAGEEFLRSKPTDETGTAFSSNSYNAPDSVNSLKWDQVSANKAVYDYYKGLIAFRKAHAAFRMTTTTDIQNNLTFMDVLDPNVVAYTINNSPNGETAKAICVIYNPNKATTNVTIPEGDWNVYIKGDKAGTDILETISGGTVTVDPISALVLVQEDKQASAPTDAAAVTAAPTEAAQTTAPAADKADSNNTLTFVLIGAAVVIVAAAAAFIVIRRKKK
jgi:pullulanase